MIRLSIVVATWNRGESLVRTLESLVQQNLAPEKWEAIVVDNNSTDNTQELFARFAAANPEFNIRIVREPKQGLSHARNRGITESHAPIIAIIDDDETVNTSFGHAYIELFNACRGAAAAGGIIIPEYQTPPPHWLSSFTRRPITGELSLGRTVREFPAKRFPGGGNMAILKSALVEMGGFDPELGRTGKKLLAGEEKDLFARLRATGGKIYYTPDAVIRHFIPSSRLTISYLARVSRMSGVSERVRVGIVRAITAETFKWAATIVLALFYTLTLRPAKAWGLFVLRWNVSRGCVAALKNRRACPFSIIN